MTCVIGIDIGTTSTIGILLDTKRNKILKKISFNVKLISLEYGWAEEDPNQWWKNTQNIIKSLSKKAKNSKKKIIAIGVTGMLPALVILDKKNNVIRNSIQQSDSRTENQIKKIFNKNNSNWFIKKTNCGINQQLIAPKLLWLKENEHHLNKQDIKVIRNNIYHRQFVNFKISGNYKECFGIITNSGLNLLNIRNLIIFLTPVVILKKLLWYHQD